MSLDHSNVKQCIGLGHVYSSVLTVRCGHRESYHTVGRVWVDTYDDDTYTLYVEELDHGPFEDSQTRGKAIMLLWARVHRVQEITEMSRTNPQPSPFGRGQCSECGRWAGVHDTGCPLDQ